MSKIILQYQWTVFNILKQNVCGIGTFQMALRKIDDMITKPNELREKLLIPILSRGAFI